MLELLALRSLKTNFANNLKKVLSMLFIGLKMAET